MSHNATGRGMNFPAKLASRAAEFATALWEALPGSGAFDAVDYLNVHVPAESVESPHGRSQMLP
ncbi:hypothetical protein BRD06_01175 [Halobacteriales archaeon QS_9_67_15]|nr:MAG: hypothetical protein BRD06_01175 [Halobacteriales archaeon QS_9_67_15]